MNKKNLAKIMKEAAHAQGYGRINWLKIAEAAINYTKGEKNGKGNDNAKHEEVRKPSAGMEFKKEIS